MKHALKSILNTLKFINCYFFLNAHYQANFNGFWHKPCQGRLNLNRKLTMKKTTFLAALLCVSTSAFSQTMNKPFSVGIHSGLVDYHGDLNRAWFNMGDYKAHIGLTGMYTLNSWLNTGIQVNYGSIGFHNPITPTNTQLGFRANMLHANAQLRLKFNNGKWMSEESKLQPYLYLGTGLSHLGARKQNDGQTLTVTGFDWTGNLGAGLTYMVTEKIGVNYNFNYAITNHDKRDNLSVGKNDQFMQHAVGVTFNFGKSKNANNATNTADSKAKDSDGDGVSDDKDKCANTPKGVKVDKYGCPIVEKEAKEILDNALKGILFETGKDVLVESSFDKLDAVATLLKANPKFKLEIDGHTDNTGGSALNKELSLKRAEAVKAYLVKKGIEESRLIAKGYGDTQPVDTNDTPEGRANNRRVELIVIQ